MNFSTYKFPNSVPNSNILVLFIDNEDPNTLEPLDIIFEEALKLAANGISIHWFRIRPSYRIPLFESTPRPNYLSMIHMHYGYNRIYSIIQEFCTKTLFINATTCSSIFIELQENNYLLTNAELVNLLALLENTANWIASRREIKKQTNIINTFPVIIFLKNLEQKQKIIISMYTNHALDWKNKNDWKDLFKWPKYK
ncbi:hypothetical protein Mgra_00004145 [Meloidogyne graminicola]|uniref:Uncharacterized protein n=1 Tax=Meloidogyne graminicola TaxID=189291 RepID=A0A8S9ZSD7_9BILA|nr:hypothetical protein Mgra_00004145 [Meloidogyne graminicola]